MSAPAPVKPTVGIEVLEQLDLRVGTIERVEDVAGSKKLVKLAVNFGDHRRTILAGMKQERADPNREAQDARERIVDEMRKHAGVTDLFNPGNKLATDSDR